MQPNSTMSYIYGDCRENNRKYMKYTSVKINENSGITGQDARNSGRRIQSVLLQFSKIFETPS